MKIAQILPINLPIPSDYGGLEKIAFELYKKLIDDGHLVTVYTCGNSKIDTKKYLYKKNVVGDYMKDYKSIFNHLSHLAWSLEDIYKNKFDVIHCHISYLSNFFVQNYKQPILTTMHGELNNKDYPERIKILQEFPNDYLVSISHFQRKGSPHVKYLANVYNGIDTNLYVPSKNYQKKEDLFWAGRLTRKKGAHVAVEVAEKSNKALKLAGPLESKEYFNEYISNNSKNIKYLKELNEPGMIDHYQKSKLVIFSSIFDEPFGLTMIESMACGTPIVAFAKGAVPEIVKDGTTGYIVNYSDKERRGNWLIKKTGVAGMVEAVKRIYSMPKKEYQNMQLNCRKHVEENFSVEKMVDGYEKVYEKVINDWKKNHKHK